MKQERIGIPASIRMQTHRVESGETENSTQHINGTYYPGEKEDEFSLEFFSTVEGEPVSKVKILCAEDSEKVTLMSGGETSSTIQLQQGKSVMTRHRTPFGDFNLTAIGRGFDVIRNPEKGGRLEIAYTLLMEGNPISDTKIKLSWILRQR